MAPPDGTAWDLAAMVDPMNLNAVQPFGALTSAQALV
jgi:hypothetical protein